MPVKHATLSTLADPLNESPWAFIQDIENAIGPIPEVYRLGEALSKWLQNQISIFSLSVLLFTVLAEHGALHLIWRFNDILRLRGSLPRIHCCLNSDTDDFVAIFDSSGSQIYVLSPLQLLRHRFSTEGLDYSDPSDWSSHLNVETAGWAIQLIHLELILQCWDTPSRKRRLKALHHLVQTFHILPPSLFLRNVTQEGQHPISGGSYADIFKGRMEQKETTNNPIPICLKALRVFQIYDQRERAKLLKEFCREALVWTHLDHPHILPCFGVSVTAIENRFCLISPWMGNGNIMEYLTSHPDDDRLGAIIGVARGLDYLHRLDPQMVHGDIKGVNILVTEEGRCVLADFGLCMMIQTHSIGASATSSGLKGTTRWSAPELLMPTEEKFRNPDRAGRDIYAFACTVLEIYTGKAPFSSQQLEVAVIFDVLQGKCPARPPEMQASILDDVWELMTQCWHEDSHLRPCAQHVLERLEQVSLAEAMTAKIVPDENVFLAYSSLVLSSRSNSPSSPLFPPSPIGTDALRHLYNLPSPISVSSSSSMIDNWSIALLGHGPVGKTSLAVRFVYDTFDDHDAWDPTIENTYNKYLTVDNSDCLMTIIDTAGFDYDEYTVFREIGIRECHAVVLIYSVDSRDSFEQLHAMRDTANKAIGDPVCIIVGNKADKTQQRKVSEREGMSLANKWGYEFVETCTRSRQGVDHVFEVLVRVLRGLVMRNETVISPEHPKQRKGRGLVMRHETVISPEHPKQRKGRRLVPGVLTKIFRS